MPRPSRWVAKHKGCQAAMDNVTADLTTEIERLKAENARLREWLEPLEAWTSSVLRIVKDRRIPSSEVIADGEAVVAEARSALDR